MFSTKWTKGVSDFRRDNSKERSRMTRSMQSVIASRPIPDLPICNPRPAISRGGDKTCRGREIGEKTTKKYETTKTKKSRAKNGTETEKCENRTERCRRAASLAEARGGGYQEHRGFRPTIRVGVHGRPAGGKIAGRVEGGMMIVTRREADRETP